MPWGQLRHHVRWKKIVINFLIVNKTCAPIKCKCAMSYLKLRMITSHCVWYVLFKLGIFNSTTSDVQQPIKGDDGLMCDVLSTSENVITHNHISAKTQIRHRVCRSSGGPCVKRVTWPRLGSAGDAAAGGPDWGHAAYAVVTLRKKKRNRIPSAPCRWSALPLPPAPCAGDT